MNSSQSYPSSLYPSNVQNYNTSVLPNINNSALSGNSADYQSKAVGGRRHRRTHHKHRKSKGGRRHRRKHKQKRKKN